MSQIAQIFRRIPGITWLLLLTSLIRIIAVAVRFENLSIDTDNYLAIAQNLMDGQGYCSSPGQPTAFRPPLYPLLVATCLICGGVAAIGAVQILLGTATVWLTWKLSLRCQFSRRHSLLAAGLVAFDPLLIHYTTQVMTETSCTFLVALLLLMTLRNESGLRQSILIGIVFGMSVLCRPSLWAFGALAALIWLTKLIVNHSSADSTAATSISLNFKQAIASVTATVITVSPWVIRNIERFDHPILMTTHGGYTLLLGNNERFFQEVVNAQRGATWQAASLTKWQAENERRLSDLNIAPTDELARDAAHARLARAWITDNPLGFLQACLLRIQRFWACWPSTSAGLPDLMIQLVGTYYAVILVLALVGAFRWRAIWLNAWTLPVLVLALAAVHSVYWSNARMRSPAVPVISILAATALQRPDHSEPSGQRRQSTV